MKKLDKRGAIAAMMVLAITAVLGCGALVIDGGLLYFERARLQTALDSAVLAGARVLREGATVARQAALEAAAANGVSSAEITVTVDATRRTVSASARRQVALGLARVLEMNQAEVAAESAAGSAGVSGVAGAVPLGVPWEDFVFGQVYQLKEGGGSGSHGNFGALALGGRGAANYREKLEHGYQGWLRVGDQIETEPGNMSGPTSTAVTARLAACGHQPPCTHEQFAPGCPRLVTVPIVSSLPNGRGEVTILGFAGFYLEGVGGQGNENYINGRFLRLVTQGEAGPAGDYGLQVVKLQR